MVNKVLIKRLAKMICYERLRLFTEKQWEEEITDVWEKGEKARFNAGHHEETPYQDHQEGPVHSDVPYGDECIWDKDDREK